VKKDFDSAAMQLDNILRRRVGEKIYFVAYRDTNTVSADCRFRAIDKAPELWNAVTGERKFAGAYEIKGGQTNT
jgi:hypothetical protein